MARAGSLAFIVSVYNQHHVKIIHRVNATNVTTAAGYRAGRVAARVTATKNSVFVTDKVFIACTTLVIFSPRGLIYTM